MMEYPDYNTVEEYNEWAKKKAWDNMNPWPFVLISAFFYALAWIIDSEFTDGLSIILVLVNVGGLWVYPIIAIVALFKLQWKLMLHYIIAWFPLLGLVIAWMNHSGMA